MSVKLVRLAGAVLALAMLLHARFLRCVTDDAYITFRFARHLADGHGLVWNIGEPPVEGYTNFLWLLWCAMAAKVGFDLPLFSQIAGAAASLVTMAYTYRFGRKLLGMSRGLALFPCLLLSASGPFVTWAMAGMETSLFGCLMLASLYHFARAGQRERPPITAFVLVFLATLTRPEGLVVFATLAVLYLWSPGWGTARQRLLTPIVYLGCFAAYFVWRYQYFGQLLPNTFYAKVGMSGFIVARGLGYTAYFVGHFVAPWLPLIVLLAWGRGGLLPMIRSMRTALERRERLPRLGVAALLGAYVLCVVGLGGDYMAMYRFFVPVLPFTYLVVAEVLRGVLGAASAGSRRRVVVGGCIVFGVGLTLLHSTPADALLFRRPPMMHGHYLGVQTERMATRRFVTVGRFFDRHKRNPQETLATPVIGAIGYYSNMRILDMLGLTDPHIAHAPPAQSLGLGFPGHERADLLYVVRRRPTYVLLALDPDPVTMPEGSHEALSLLRSAYVQRNVWYQDSMTGFQGYVHFLELERPS